MGKKKTEKRKARKKKSRKQLTKQKESSRNQYNAQAAFDEAKWQIERGRLDKAMVLMRKAVRLDPGNVIYWEFLENLAYDLKDMDTRMLAFEKLYEMAEINPNYAMIYGMYLVEDDKNLKRALTIFEALYDCDVSLSGFPDEIVKKEIKEWRDHCRYRIDVQNRLKEWERDSEADKKAREDWLWWEGEEKREKKKKSTPKVKRKKADTKPEIDVPISISFDTTELKKSLKSREFASPERYETALAGYEMSFRESFDRLLCLAGLKNVHSYWYQEETAKKVLKSFRGRALLADEVGLGKTIEALMTLKEYMQRGLVESALILTPPSLLTQWRDEMSSKFGLSFVTTEDGDYRDKGDEFWKNPFILSSLNIAKSKRNFDKVTSREYDMVIVDEAHHVKNRSTQSWKLVNALKKRFILLLTATPVSNNLMELYNLITLLKPGQLKTQASFKSEFVSRGDPTDPRNRERLRELLKEVMIRNTRSLANINLPPRYAETIQVEPNEDESMLYERLTSLVRSLSRGRTFSNKMVLKILLEEIGSSPQALYQTLESMVRKRDFPSATEDEIMELLDMCGRMQHTGKCLKLLDLLNAIREKTIVFVKYKATLEYLSYLLDAERIPYAIFHGSMNIAEKDRQIDLFRDERLVLLSTESGGEGRNLQFCSNMINFDLPWNPMKIEQRIGRIHRIGQQNEVHIYNLCANGSIEDYMLEILDKKVNMFELVIGEIDMILGRLRGEKDFANLIYEIWIGSENQQDRKKAFDNLGRRMKTAKKGYEKTKELDEKLFEKDYEL